MAGNSGKNIEGVSGTEAHNIEQFPQTLYSRERTLPRESAVMTGGFSNG